MNEDMKTVYLDNSATTAICDGALERYVEVSKNIFGNPSSLHAFGLAAEREINAARRILLDAVGAKDSALIFTASGSEANNLAILGRAFAKDRFLGRSKIITTEGEHASVSSPLEALEKKGFKVVRIPTVGGKLDENVLKAEMTPDVILVTMMMVNNETGALYDIKAVSEIMKMRAPGAYLHVDATQSFMKLPFTKASLGADMITLSSHKIEGPKGVGALVVGNKIIKEKGLTPLILGGGQEGGLRSGTENVPAVSAFAEAARLAAPHVRARQDYLEGLRASLINAIEKDGVLSEISVTKPDRHAPHIVNLTLPKIKSETMLHFLSSRGIYVSSGSACSSNTAHVSSALVAFGRTPIEADTSVRVSLSHKNTGEDIATLVVALREGLLRLSRIR